MGLMHSLRILFGSPMLILPIAAAHPADGRSIAGEYTCASGCRLTDASPSVAIEGDIAHCMNELGGTYSGTVLSPTSIYCFNKTGQLSGDGQSILWSNGSIWTRNPPDPNSR